MSEIDELKSFKDELFKEGIGMGIVMSLFIYETLNLKKISKLLNKGETTVLNQVKKLLESGAIEIDSKESAISRGKYYKLTDKTKDALDYTDDETLEKLNEIWENPSKDKLVAEFLKSILNPNFENMIDQVRSLNLINNYIEKISIENLRNIQDSVNVLENDNDRREYLYDQNFPTGAFSLTFRSFKLQTLLQVKEFIEMYNHFLKEIDEFSKKIKKENEKHPENEIDVNQYIYLSALPIFRDLNE